MKLRQVAQNASLKDETLNVRIKARPAVTAPRRKFNGSQSIIFESLKWIAKWVKREIPFSNSALQRWKIEAAAYQRLCFSLKPLALPVGKAGEACCSLQCHFWSPEKIQLPLQGAQVLAHIHQPHADVSDALLNTIGPWCSGTRTEP